MDPDPRLDQLITLPRDHHLKISRPVGFDTLCWVAAFVLLAASPALLIAAWGWAL